MVGEACMLQFVGKFEKRGFEGYVGTEILAPFGRVIGTPECSMWRRVACFGGKVAAVEAVWYSSVRSLV